MPNPVLKPPARPCLPALAAAVLAAGGAAAQTGAAPPLQPSVVLKPLPRGEAGKRLPILLEAQSVETRPDLDTVASGDVEFRRGGLVIRADRLSYDQREDMAIARGQVRIAREGAVYSGPELQLRVQRFEGFFLEPRYEFLTLGSGGRAERIDFIDSARSRAIGAEYTSCPRDQPGEPDWVLKTDRVEIDLEKNEGVAEGAVLRFLGTPILALPRLTFPLSDARKSGWLPPSINTDNRSGVEVAVPWYWNIAPNRDATLIPRVITRRGLGFDGEFRYLEPSLEGAVQWQLLPDDRVYGRSREAVQWLHDGTAFGRTRYFADVVRVSDDDWWKDFPGSTRSFTPRLLPARLGVEQPLPWGDGLAYVRALRWQVLQASELAVIAPYERSPQAGLRFGGRAGRVEYGLEAEYNRFTLPGGETARAGRAAGGERVHVLASVALPWRHPGWWLTPRLSVNSARYADAPGRGGAAAARTIPTLALDAGVELERETSAFGRPMRQTLEPRLLYVNTPYREQASLPNYDAAAKDFNFTSIYSDNPFSGVDRVADTHAVTAGFTTRYVDAETGVEALRLGLVQRVQLRDQRVAPLPDGSPDGPPQTQRFSDALLLGSTTVFPGWTLDAAAQYSPDLRRSVRTIVGARWSPGPFRTVGATYRLARGLSEQVELGWQWPLFERAAREGSSCSGTLYSVGRVNYSLRDRRVTDSVLGAEYDAGCWIGRFVYEQLSTGRSEATRRFMVQLELVGLSRLGSNPLRVLKDNIPGYRLLREERRSLPADAAFFHE